MRPAHALDAAINALAAAPPPEPAPDGLSAPAQAAYLVLGVTLLGFLLIFIVIGVNAVRRLARRRESLERAHAPKPASTHAESAWVAAGRRAQPVDPPDLDETDLDDDRDPPGALPA